MTQVETRTEAETELLDAVLATIKGTPNPRLREVMTALVRHLHEFASEVQLTQAEWLMGINFLTAVGKFSTDERNEFILLSDVLGLSSLVETVGFGGTDEATANTVLGPFWQPDSPHRANGASILDTPDPDAPVLKISGSVKALDGSPIANASVDVWMAARNGLYWQQDPKQARTNLRGVFHTDANGRYSFETVRPVSYPVPMDGPVGPLMNAMARSPMRATHIHFIVKAPGYKTVTTHLFDSECPYLETDAVFSVRESLVQTFGKEDGHYTASFNVTLMPEN
jgi:protocatechuate 3,4-dioxygenase beta subunit